MSENNVQITSKGIKNSLKKYTALNQYVSIYGMVLMQKRPKLTLIPQIMILDLYRLLEFPIMVMELIEIY